MWSDQPTTLPRWFNLPIDIPSYAYQTSFEYKGLYSVLHRVNQFVDRHVQSAQELVDDSQLYQAFMFKYSTESYRRKKYHSINGTRIWAYGEDTPGIRFNFMDYYRIPKMGYYYLKNAQARFAVSFAYEQALESQVSGTARFWTFRGGKFGVMIPMRLPETTKASRWVRWSGPRRTSLASMFCAPAPRRRAGNHSLRRTPPISRLRPDCSRGPSRCS
jgi:hypothetical protein